jgi:phage shock protein C
MEQMSSARLFRSRDKILGGVCGGLAKWLGWDVTLVRIAYIIISILSAAFPGTIVYIILWMIMPEE